MNEPSPCPCGSRRSFTACCQSIIKNDSASTPELLMRSRYSAYVLGYWDYLHRSWHPDTRPASVSPTPTNWLGLTIVQTSKNSVEFIAGFKEGSKVILLHETSPFQQVEGHWRYLDGKCNLSEAGRNTLCPCNSGLKCKRCCAKTNLNIQTQLR